MNKKLLLLPLVSCVLLASCTEEGANDTTNQTELPKQAQGKAVTFTAAPVSIETKSASTKVNVKPDGDNDILEWTSEDISFFFFGGNDNYYYEDFAVTVTDGFTGKQISMTGHVPDDEGNYGIYAISPAGDYFKGNVSPTSTVTISQEQTQTLSNGSYTHLSDYIFLYSNPSEVLEVDAAGNSDGELEMSFTPLSSLLRFDISTTSAEPVALNSITIKYVNGSGQGKLYRSATLNEYYGTLTGNDSDTYSDMTLNLPANTVVSGSSTYIVYMAVFPSDGEGVLEITLSITSGTVSTTLIYNCPDVLFVSGARTHIDLLIDKSEVPDAGGVFTSYIGDNAYLCALYPSGPSGENQIWMVDGSREGNSEQNQYGSYPVFTFANRFTACPEPWRVPSFDEAYRLLGNEEYNYRDLGNQFWQYPWLNENGFSQDQYGTVEFWLSTTFSDTRDSGYIHHIMAKKQLIPSASARHNNHSRLVRCVRDL